MKLILLSERTHGHYILNGTKYGKLCYNLQGFYSVASQNFILMYEDLCGKKNCLK